MLWQARLGPWNGSKRSMTTPTSEKALNNFDHGGAQVDARLPDSKAKEAPWATSLRRLASPRVNAFPNRQKIALPPVKSRSLCSFLQLINTNTFGNAQPSELKDINLGPVRPCTS